MVSDDEFAMIWLVVFAAFCGAAGEFGNVRLSQTFLRKLERIGVTGSLIAIPILSFFWLVLAIAIFYAAASLVEVIRRILMPSVSSNSLFVAWIFVGVLIMQPVRRLADKLLD